MNKKKKSQRSFWYIVARDVWVIFRTVFWGIPKATVTELRLLDFVSVRNYISITSDDAGWAVVLGLYAILVLTLAFVFDSFFTSVPICIGLVEIFVIPAILLSIPIRYIWYRAVLQEEEERVLKHNLEYIELCDDELTEDFYNTVSGSGG